MRQEFSDHLVFLAVATEGSVTAAAAAMGVSKSTVSNALSRLECMLGLKLIQRSTRRLRLTEAGQRLLLHCERIKAELAEARHSMEAYQKSVSGKIVITCPTASGHVFLPKLLNGFRKQHPGIDFTVELTDEEADLIGQGVDLAFRTGAKRDSNFIARHLMDFPIKIYASPSLATSLPEKPKDLARYDCLYHPAIPQWSLHNGEEAYSFKPPQNISARNFTFLRQLLLDGKFLAAMPSYLVEKDVQAGRIIGVLGDWAIVGMPFALVYPSKQQPSRVISKFIEYTLQYFTTIKSAANG